MGPLYRKLLGTLADVGEPASPGATILDLGCGNGDIVRGLLDLGYDAYGCDNPFKPGRHVDDLFSSGRIRLLESDPYRLPFDDGTIDVVCSMQVFEHVHDYVSTFREIWRVLKPGGCALHQFPSRYRFIETHIFVPLASVIQSYAWLRFWAQIGIRKPNQRDMDPKAVADENFAYLHNHTRYHTRRQIDTWARQVFDDFQYCELERLRYTRLRKWHPLLRRVPFLGFLLREFHTRVLLTRKTAAGERSRLTP